MAGMNDFLTSLNLGGVINFVGLALLGLGILGLSIFVIYKLYRRKQYNIPVEVIDLDDTTGVAIHDTDKAAIIYNRDSKMSIFQLRKYKVAMNCDSIPYVRTPKGKKVFVYRYGLKNFAFMTPTISNPSMDFSVGTEDITWGLIAFDRGQKAFVNTFLGQILQYLPFIFGGFVIIILAFFMFKNIPALKELAISLKEAAQEVAKAKAGTVVVGG